MTLNELRKALVDHLISCWDSTQFFCRDCDASWGGSMNYQIEGEEVCPRCHSKNIWGERLRNITYLLECHECGAQFTKKGCGCIVTDCPNCGEVAGVWTKNILGDVHV